MSSSNVDKIKERLNITDVVGSVVKLEKAGSNLKARCPFHNEKTPSFFVSPDRGTYYCFGCGAKGDIFTFTQEFEGLDFPGALKILASRAGVELKKENIQIRTDKERMLQVIDTATLFFEKNLGNNKEALEYLGKRGIKASTLKNWRIGFAPDSWQETSSYLKGKGFKEEEIKRVGLIKQSSEKPGRLYDVFRNRIIFPIFDTAGRPVAFSGRLLKEDENAPKYLNSPETLLFNKSEILYGFDKAKTDIRMKNYSILTEGQIDLILSHQEGFTNTVASSGTALTTSQLSRLNRLSGRVILAYDGDSAGFKALQKSAKLALALGMNVRIASLPAGEDPASLILKDKNKYFDLLKNSLHIIEFYLEKIISSKMEKRQIDRELKKKVLPFIKILPSNIDQSRFIMEIADKTGLREKALWEELEKIEPEQIEENLEEKSEAEHKPREAQSRKNNIAFRILGFIAWQQEDSKNSQFDFKELKERLVNLVGEDLLSKFEERKDEAIFEAQAYYTGKENLKDILEDLFAYLEEGVLKEKFEVIMRELALAEKSSDKDKVNKLLTDCREISKKINNLNIKRAEQSSKF